MPADAPPLPFRAFELLDDDVTPAMRANLERVYLDSLRTEHTRSAYRQALRALADWRESQAPTDHFSAQLVDSYIASLSAEYETARTAGKKSRVSAATINQRLAAFRHLARSAERADILSARQCASVLAIRGLKVSGTRTLTWLTQDETQKLLSLPDKTTLRGSRDHAILAVLFQCGLRRSEVTSLTVEHLVQEEDRCLIKNLEGKHRHTRDVTVPRFTERAIDEWMSRSGIVEGKLFRAVNKNSRVWGVGLTPEAVLQIVRSYSKDCEFDGQSKYSRRGVASKGITPHDARRTFAQLCRKKDGNLEEIRDLLGHKSISTTEKYLGKVRHIRHAVNDRLDFE
jgi:site-specific recombinase XerD